MTLFKANLPTSNLQQSIMSYLAETIRCEALFWVLGTLKKANNFADMLQKLTVGTELSDRLS
jgi:hypothetical protein